MRPARPPIEMDDSSKYLLDRAKAVRSRPVWEPEPAVSRFERPSPPKNYSNGSYFERPQPPMERDPEESMMSSKTRYETISFLISTVLTYFHLQYIS